MAKLVFPRGRSLTVQHGVPMQARTARALSILPEARRQVAAGKPWQPVHSLPGYAVQSVRQMGSQVFQGFGAIDLRAVDIRSTMSESEESLRDLARWIGNNATCVDRMTYTFPTPDRGPVECRAVLWRSNNTPDSYVIVSDFAGTYVYQFRGMPQIALRPQQDRLAGSGRPLLPGPGPRAR